MLVNPPASLSSLGITATAAEVNQLAGVAFERRLSTTTVNLNTTAAQDLYTVPAGKTLVVTKAILRSPSVDVSGQMGITLGFIENGAGDFVTGSIDFSFPVSPVAARQVYIATPDGNYSLVAAAGKVQAALTTAIGFAATGTVDLFGYLF